MQAAMALQLHQSALRVRSVGVPVFSREAQAAGASASPTLGFFTDA